MTTKTERTGVDGLVAFEVALEVIQTIKGLVPGLRKQDGELTRQIVRAASSIAANVAEGSRRVGGDRKHFFRIAAGSAEETGAHLRVALAWGYLQSRDVEQALQLLDRQLRLLRGLTR